MASRRFRSYQPSTALRQAIDALNLARKNRDAAGEPQRLQHPGQGEGGPDAPYTPGQESADIGEGSGAGTDIDALVSGRKTSTRKD